MPTKPPSDRTRAKGVPPVVNPGLSAGDTARNLKIRIPPDMSRPNYVKRTQSTWRTCQKCKTNPISVAADLWKCKKCETNPIYPYRWRLAGSPAPQFGKTNPISGNSLAFPCPKCAKHTQFPVRARSRRAGMPQICETNPIYPYRWRLAGSPAPRLCKTPVRPYRSEDGNPIPNHQYTVYNIQYTILWPNSNKQI